MSGFNCDDTFSENKNEQGEKDGFFSTFKMTGSTLKATFKAASVTGISDLN